VELLSKLTRASVRNVEAGCCGIAGTYGMQKKNYEASMKIGEGLAEALKAAGADETLTECGACKMQIEHLTGRPAMHPVKLLAKAYGLM